MRSLLLAKALEQGLFHNGMNVYYPGVATIDRGLDADLGLRADSAGERLRRIGELAPILTDAGLILSPPLMMLTTMILRP